MKQYAGCRMKLVDKYILKNVLTPLTYCLLAFLMLFVIFDLFSNLSDFIEAGTPLPQVLRFYIYLLPSILIFIVPISLLLAVLYGLSSLTRSNELTAMRASGISLYRLMIPIIGIGLCATLIVGAVNETLAPWSAYWTDQFVRAETYDGEVSFFVTQNLPYKNPRERRDWIIGEFDRETYDMLRIEVYQEHEGGAGSQRLIARKGQWDGSQWWFFDVTTQELDPRGYPMGAPRTVSMMMMDQLNEQPRDFINVTKDPEFLSSRELIAFLRAHQHISEEALARHAVDLHYRLAMPWTCLIVTLLGLPMGAHTGRKGALRGIIMALVLFFSFYVFINLGMALGKKQMIDPWLSVWTPNLIFLVIGVVMVRHMR